MIKLETLQPNAALRGIVPNVIVAVFGREPDFGVTSVNYGVAELLARTSEPS